MNEPAEKQKRGSSRIWVPVILLVGILLGAVAGFISMIRRALGSGADEDQQERDKPNGGH